MSGRNAQTALVSKIDLCENMNAADYIQADTVAGHVVNKSYNYYDGNAKRGQFAYGKEAYDKFKAFIDAGVKICPAQNLKEDIAYDFGSRTVFYNAQYASKTTPDSRLEALYELGEKIFNLIVLRTPDFWSLKGPARISAPQPK
jgi:hypothetical protein